MLLYKYSKKAKAKALTENGDISWITQQFL